jgi:signal transduction histidine kinase
MLVPIRAAGEASGVLVFVREGEMDRSERVSVAGLGAYIGLALENARLAATQRRFAAELEAKVAAATRELHVIDQAKSAFVAVASHELRTPLTALRGFSELLATRTYSSSEVRRYARVMVDESERLARIVDDLLDLSRLERGLEPPLRRRRVEVELAMRGVATLFDRPGVTHRIDVDYAPGTVAVDADPDALDRILTNLVANAMKYSPPGVVRLTARPDGAMVRFVVADEGPGMAPAALARIFEPYFRVDESVDAPRGTGLGLAVVKALVEAHGGSVGIESAPKMGTQVHFTMPAVC